MSNPKNHENPENLNPSPPIRKEKDDAYWQYKGGDLDFAACVFCVHKHANSASCTAFPEGIPRPILLGENPHDEPYPGDGGIQFEPLPDAPDWIFAEE